MRSVVFLFFHSKERQWRIETSIAFSVDQWWYQKKNEKQEKLIPLTPYLPNYIALYVRETFENALKKNPAHEVSIRSILAIIRREVAQMNQQFPQYSFHIDQILQESLLFTKNYHEETVYRIWLEEDAKQILPYIEGRVWLEEQVQKRLEMVNVNLQGIQSFGLSLANYLPFLLQYLYIQKEIELNAGVTLIRKGNTFIAKCERCGSIRKQFVTQYCSLCKHDDIICDICYTVGASKGCSLVISRARDLETNRLESRKEVENVPMHWSGEL